MDINEVKKIVKSANLSGKAKNEAEEVLKSMEKQGVTDYLMGHLVRIIESEAKMNKEEIKYFQDVNTTLKTFLSDAENRLKMAYEEIEDKDN